MFSWFSKPKKQTSEAAQRTNLPLNDHMTLLFAQELPLLDSHSRQRVYRLLEAYEGPEICSQEELPAELRALLDL